MMRWILTTLLDWIIIVLAALFLPFWLAPLIIGNRIHAISIMGHEAIHNLTGLGRFNNLAAQVLCFWPMGLDLNGIKDFHLKHHRYLGTSDDPELETRNKIEADGLSLWVSIKDYIGLGLPRLFQVLQLFVPKNKFRLIPGLIAQIILITLLPWYYILLWYFSFLTSTWMFFRRRVWIEHIPEIYQKVTLPWWKAWLVAPHNAWYHYEHHRRPYIPYYNLPKARLGLI